MSDKVKQHQRRAHFLWSHKACFSYQTPAGWMNFEYVCTHWNDMTLMWLMCLISPGLLAGATTKHTLILKQTHMRAFQTNRCSGPVFCLLLWVSSDYAQPITGQVTWPGYWSNLPCGWAQPELTQSKRQKMGPDLVCPIVPGLWSQHFAICTNTTPTSFSVMRWRQMASILIYKIIMIK